MSIAEMMATLKHKIIFIMFPFYSENRLIRMRYNQWEK